MLHLHKDWLTVADSFVFTEFPTELIIMTNNTCLSFPAALNERMEGLFFICQNSEVYYRKTYWNNCSENEEYISIGYKRTRGEKYLM